ncbi:hypothetical protein [Clostridium felsineum]|uniref:Uncharacterized protein n=1 Tax=Clostridium felsineum TaxID=36839 RepID=A0A1S8LDA7_9CLOT|nr:hypothetical protein [Clostridium felsineum]URZ09111.1 hypothetical protein CLROS_045270 [Clostridium felsineum]URZ13798.1 hypothetical protein CROST_045760 [Clostridium felsineum]URZ18683.1 hypothetical protein CLFE_047710 [Clostridium felsineum DSM 794]
MIEMFRDSKIFVVCIAKYTTGGIELLHQFVYKLNKLGLNAYMFYVGETTEDPVPDEYKKYNISCVTEIEDDPNNLLIVPEVMTMFLYKYKNIRKAIWWLSIDNYYASIELLEKNRDNPKLKAFIQDFKYFDFKDKDVLHLAQCQYIIDTLKKEGITNIYYLSDYLNRDFIEKNSSLNLKNRENIVVYNPKKGLEFTEKLIKAGNSINWKPIINMTRDEVITLLRKAKVYIDFGNHPGKDRIPREAAICGCCVITDKRGSANYFEDVPIDASFKFEDSEENIPAILNKINSCTQNFSTESMNFNNYRKIIKNSEAEFENQIMNIFENSSNIVHI